MLMRYVLPKGLRRLAKPWMGCSLNLGTVSPVRTKPHKDVKCAMDGRSCLCCFGDFHGGHIVLWEIKAILELRPGDVLLFADHLLTHSNTGIRHSMVAFTHQGVIEWFTKQFGFVTAKSLEIKKTRKIYQKVKEKERRKIRKGKIIYK